MTLPPGTSAEVQEELRKLIGYFENNRHRTDYPTYRRQGLGHRQRPDGGGLQDHRGTLEGIGHALGRGRGGHGGGAARPVRQRRQTLGRLLVPTPPPRGVNVTQVKDAHPPRSLSILFFVNVRKILRGEVFNSSELVRTFAVSDLSGVPAA